MSRPPGGRSGWGRAAIADALVLVGLIFAATAASAQSGTDATCAAATRERIRFLETELDAGQAQARWWRDGFLALRVLGVGLGSYRVATLDDRGERAVEIVRTTKALGGVAEILLWPPNALRGTAAMRDVEGCEAKRAAGERQLLRNAEQARRRTRWTAHVGVFAVNATGALIAGEGFGARREAWISAGLGLAVGEMMLWLYPDRARTSLVEYEQRFGAGLRRQVQVDVVPTLGGVALTVRY